MATYDEVPTTGHRDATGALPMAGGPGCPVNPVAVR